MRKDMKYAYPSQDHQDLHAPQHLTPQHAPQLASLVWNDAYLVESRNQYRKERR